MFKIGEFARIADVSIHLLRHYDDIDLFKPAQIDPQSGYRYYHADQLPMLHRIVALRELGMTLEQIATMLDDAITDCEPVDPGQHDIEQNQVVFTAQAKAQAIVAIVRGFDFVTVVDEHVDQAATNRGLILDNQ